MMFMPEEMRCCRADPCTTVLPLNIGLFSSASSTSSVHGGQTYWCRGSHTQSPLYALSSSVSLEEVLSCPSGLPRFELSFSLPGPSGLLRVELYTAERLALTCAGTTAILWKWWQC